MLVFWFFTPVSIFVYLIHQISLLYRQNEVNVGKSSDFLNLPFIYLILKKDVINSTVLINITRLRWRL